jgi:hypothetical protein
MSSVKYSLAIIEDIVNKYNKTLKKGNGEYKDTLEAMNIIREVLTDGDIQDGVKITKNMLIIIKGSENNE